MEVNGQHHTSTALLPREKAPGSLWIGGWVGSRASLDAVAKRKISYLPLLGIESRLFSQQSSHYSKLLLKSSLGKKYRNKAQD
jgi:hypothetical protein